MTAAHDLAAALGARIGEVDGRRVVPMLSERESSPRALSRKDFFYELKLDGVRIVADKVGDRVALTYRKSRDATPSYPEIAEAIAKLGDERLVLDGEIIAFDDAGRPDFQRLATRIQSQGLNARRAAATVPVVYVVFDVLAVGDRDLRRLPIEARKEILARIVQPESGAGALLRYHPVFDDGEALFRLCTEHHLEGVIAKRHGSIYRPGERTSDWLKIKRELDADLVVVAWAEGEGKRSRLGALDLASYEHGRLVLRGSVGSGLDEDTIDALLARLKPLAVPYAVAEGTFPPKKVRQHVRPEMVVSVRYAGFSREDDEYRLRFPVFRGLRPDVAPEDCTVSPEEPEADVRRRRLHLSAPNRAALPDGTTKHALCKYFESVADALLPPVRGRPCALVRPDGVALWPPPKWTPAGIRALVLHGKTRDLRGWALDDVAALAFLVEAGCVTIEYGPRHEDSGDLVDFVALRVDGETRDAIVSGATALREIGREIGLPASVKTAGALSLDVILALGRAPETSAPPLAALIAGLATKRTGASVRPLDAIAAAYAPCRPFGGGATLVSVPIAWDELARADPSRFGLEAAAERAAAGAPIFDVRALEVDLPAAIAALEKLL